MEQTFRESLNIISTRGRRDDGLRDSVKSRQVVGMIPSGIVAALFAGTVGVTGSPYQQQKGGVAGVVSFRTRPPHHL